MFIERDRDGKWVKANVLQMARKPESDILPVAYNISHDDKGNYVNKLIPKRDPATNKWVWTKHKRMKSFGLHDYHKAGEYQKSLTGGDQNKHAAANYPVHPEAADRMDQLENLANQAQNGGPDWRPNEVLPEDYYALGRKGKPIRKGYLEDLEHNEAEAALAGGEPPSSDLIGKLKPGTKKTVGGKQYLRSMDGPHELTTVDPNSFGYRPQTYRNQAIITKYRDVIRRAIQAGKKPAEAVEPVQGEPFQREDVNEGKPTNYLRDGNHRVDAAIAEGLPEVPAWFPMKKARLRRLLQRIRKAAKKQPSEWDQIVEHWTKEPADKHTFGILADYLEQKGNPNHTALRSPEGLAKAHQEWFWNKYPNGGQLLATGVWRRREQPHSPAELTRQKLNTRGSVEAQALKFFNLPQGHPGLKIVEGAGGFKDFLQDLPNHNAQVKMSLPSRSGQRPQRLAKKSGYQYISVPEPLTTANSQHWLDYNLQPHEKGTVERSRVLGNEIEKTSPMSMTLQSTIAGRHGRHWYDENHDILRAATHHSSDPRDFHRLAGLEAATSPNAGIVPNQHGAYDLFRLWHTGAMVGKRHIPARTENSKELATLIDAYGLPSYDRIPDPTNPGKKKLVRNKDKDVRYPPDYKIPELRGQPLLQVVPHPNPSGQNEGILKQIHTHNGWENLHLFAGNTHGFLAHKVLANIGKFTDKNSPGNLTTDPVKADSFLRNKLGNQDAVTIDRHEARGYGFNIGEKKKDPVTGEVSTQQLSPGLYHFLAAAGRHVARLLNRPEYNPLHEHPIHGQGWTPARGQAARWMTMRGISDAIKRGASSEEAALNLKARDIYNTSSFVQMFKDPRYMNRIKTMMAEGSLPPDFMKRVGAVERQYAPSNEELDQTVGHPDLVPLARRIAHAIHRGEGGKKKREQGPTLPGF